MLWIRSLRCSGTAFAAAFSARTLLLHQQLSAANELLLSLLLFFFADKRHGWLLLNLELSTWPCWTQQISLFCEYRCEPLFNPSSIHNDWLLLILSLPSFAFFKEVLPNYVRVRWWHPQNMNCSAFDLAICVFTIIAFTLSNYWRYILWLLLLQLLRICLIELVNFLLCYHYLRFMLIFQIWLRRLRLLLMIGIVLLLWGTSSRRIWLRLGEILLMLMIMFIAGALVYGQGVDCTVHETGGLRVNVLRGPSILRINLPNLTILLLLLFLQVDISLCLLGMVLVGDKSEALQNNFV